MLSTQEVAWLSGCTERFVNCRRLDGDLKPLPHTNKSCPQTFFYSEACAVGCRYAMQMRQHGAHEYAIQCAVFAISRMSMKALAHEAAAGRTLLVIEPRGDAEVCYFVKPRREGVTTKSLKLADEINLGLALAQVRLGLDTLLEQEKQAAATVQA
jgi:hypothetical protein